MSGPQLAILLIGAGGGAFLLSMILTRIAMPLARRIGYVDHPGGHKSHESPTCYGGGVAIFLATWAPMALALLIVGLAGETWLEERFGHATSVYLSGLGMRAGSAWLILAGGLILHVMGLVDDRRPLPPMLKLGVILGVGALVSGWGGIRIAEFAGPPISIILTMLFLAVMINALNFLDNMDGLSAGIAAICTAFLIVCGLLAGQILVPAMASVFLGAVLGFLLFNFPPAKIFMGDAGSLVVGYMLAIVAIMTTYYESGQDNKPYALAMPLVILAVPLYDFVSVMIIRISEGRNPMRGDQRHFSHRLVERGLSRKAAVLTIYLATATTGLCATLLPNADRRETITVGVIVVLVLAIIAILEAPLKNGR